MGLPLPESSMTHVRTDKPSLKPSRKGISLFEGDIRELDGKVEWPGALTIAEYTGLELWWEYQQTEGLIRLFLQDGKQVSSPILRIPLTEVEAKQIDGYQELGGWGYYDMRVEENDDRAAIQISFKNAQNESTSLLWILNKRRRALVRRAVDCFVGLRDPIFGD
jgi:hypothetical protein